MFRCDCGAAPVSEQERIVRKCEG
ncbi:MAG: DUF1922 domain-containing protein [Spirochaetaceae bacterium]|nr:DUF1922 domain-containing protein [Spirochaetaceae bacterium]